MRIKMKIKEVFEDKASWRLVCLLEPLEMEDGGKFG